MREKVRTLLGDGKKDGEPSAGRDKKMAALIRLAFFMASNSAPDACQEILKAFAEGVTEKEIKLCRSIARMVRENAMKFSDEEIGERLAAGTQEEEKGGLPWKASAARAAPAVADEGGGSSQADSPPQLFR